MRAQPTTSWSEILREALDNAWEPLTARLVGLSETEYWWLPVDGDCWTIVSRDGGWFADWADPDPSPAPVTTIAWRCWHIAVDCLASYSCRLFGRSGIERAGTEWVGTWDEARVAMDRSWSTFRSGVGSWSDEDLLEPLGAAWGPFANHSRADLALHAAREVNHHGAEIALLRDIYAAQVDR